MIRCLRYIFMLFLVQSSFWSFAQSENLKRSIDSLESVLKSAKADTNKVKLLIKIASKNKTFDPDKTVFYSQQALRLAKELRFTKGIFKSYEMLTTGMKYSGQLPELMPYLETWERMSDSLKNDYQKAQCLNTKGIILMELGEYSRSVECYFKAMKIDEKLNDKYSLASDYGNIALVYESMKKYRTAIEYINKALEIDKEIDDKDGYANAIGNLSNEYSYLGDNQTALKYAFEFLKLGEEAGNKNNIAGALSNIGSIYDEIGEKDKAIEYYKRALPMAEEMGTDDIIIVNQINLGNLFLDKAQLKEAAEVLNKALVKAKENDLKPYLSEIYRLLALVCRAQKNFEKAYDFLDKYNQIKDTLLNAENTRQVNQMSAMYEKDKQQMKIDALEKEKTLSAQVIEKQNSFRNVLIVVVILIILLAIVLLMAFMNKRKDNRLLEFSNLEIQQQKEVIEEKNKNITDSINYAKRIQESVLPAKEVKYAIFPDAFVFYQPRDIVSGDFYWFGEKNGKRVIASVDCTGHGVPGAFMSMVGVGQLNQIVLQDGITKPSEILDRLQYNMRHALKQDVTGSTTRDGMDIAICCFSADNKTIDFAGANRPLIIYKKESNMIESIDPNHISIGGSELGKDKNFTNHSFNLQSGDCLYMFTDGFADQFGGPKGKKFRVKHLKDLLISIAGEEMKKQEEILSKTLAGWKGNLEQVDDILIIGIRV